MNHHIINFILKPILFWLKCNKENQKNWRNTFPDKMIISYKEQKINEIYSFKEKLLSFIVFAIYLFLLPSFKNKKRIQKKIPGNYYPLN